MTQLGHALCSTVLRPLYCVPPLLLISFAILVLQEEVLFPPLTGIEVQNTGILGDVISVQVRLSVNLTALTIEQVVSKLQRSHLQLCDLIMDDVRLAGAPMRSVQQLEWVKRQFSCSERGSKPRAPLPTRKDEASVDMRSLESRSWQRTRCGSTTHRASARPSIACSRSVCACSTRAPTARAGWRS